MQAYIVTTDKDADFDRIEAEVRAKNPDVCNVLRAIRMIVVRGVPQEDLHKIQGIKSVIEDKPMFRLSPVY